MRRRFAALFYRLPLGLRRAAAVLFTLAITVLMVSFFVGSYAQFKEAGEYVRTQDHQSGLIVRITDFRGNGNANYSVQTGEGPKRVNYPEFLPDKHLYAWSSMFIIPRSRTESLRSVHRRTGSGCPRGCSGCG